MISIDGNNIGNRFKLWHENKKKLKENNDPEIFFHRMRVVMRTATVKALKSVFDESIEQAANKPKEVVIPYQLLMLGGDDLLLLCQPEYALKFVVALEYELSRFKLEDDRRMSFAAGVTIVKASLPFHRLIEAAESLQSSAKFLWRSQLQCDKGYYPDHSTVDWAVTTASWFDDPIEARKRFEIKQYQDDKGVVETLSLTAKPLFVGSTSHNASLHTLKSLHDAAQSLTTKIKKSQNGDPKLARSQLKQLARQLEHGRQWSEYLLSRTSSEVRDALIQKAEINHDSLWLETEIGSGRYLTRFKDLVELMELGRLGVKSNDEVQNGKG